MSSNGLNGQGGGGVDGLHEVPDKFGITDHNCLSFCMSRTFIPIISEQKSQVKVQQFEPCRNKCFH